VSIPYEYVAYIDEAGDPGLSNVKPIDQKGSEWLMLAGVLVRASNEHLIGNWDQALRVAGGRQPEHQIHFRKLWDHQQLSVCESISELPVRAFIVASNKKNMRHYRNDFAQTTRERLMTHSRSYSWMYQWLFRLLMERMSDYAVRRASSERRSLCTMKVDISRCSHAHYPDLIKYLRHLKKKDEDGTQHLKQGAINWRAINFDLIKDYPPDARAGFVLADSVASAFFAACDRVDRKDPPNPEPACALAKVMARRSGYQKDLAANYGVKLFPSFKEAQLHEEQARVFQFYGCDKVD
jgi:hypothetical protein